MLHFSYICNHATFCEEATADFAVCRVLPVDEMNQIQTKNKMSYQAKIKMPYRAKIVLFALLFAVGGICNAQSQKKIIKTNIPHWVALTPNLGLELAVGRKMSVELSGGINPFKFGENREMKHWIVWPEVRYWPHETFSGHFLGLHGMGGGFRIGALSIPVKRLEGLKNRRYEGHAFGAGVSYGYRWMLDDRWGFELTLGLGLARIDYDVYTLGANRAKINEGKKLYLGPTKGAISVVYSL